MENIPLGAGRRYSPRATGSVNSSVSMLGTSSAGAMKEPVNFLDNSSSDSRRPLRRLLSGEAITRKSFVISSLFGGSR